MSDEKGRSPGGLRLALFLRGAKPGLLLGKRVSVRLWKPDPATTPDAAHGKWKGTGRQTAAVSFKIRPPLLPCGRGRADICESRLAIARGRARARSTPRPIPPPRIQELSASPPLLLQARKKPAGLANPEGSQDGGGRARRRTSHHRRGGGGGGAVPAVSPHSLADPSQT